MFFSFCIFALPDIGCDYLCASYPSGSGGPWGNLIAVTVNGNNTLPRHIPSHSLGSPNWFSRISKLARALFSIEDANENETIIQRDRASACFSVSPFLFRCPLNATGKAGKRRTRETALNGWTPLGHHLSHADRLFPPSSLPSIRPKGCRQVLWGGSVCACPVDTCAAAVLYRLFCCASIPHVHAVYST